MHLGPLYHWSPADRRDAIRAVGLRPGQPCTVATTELDYLCLGFSPSGAWALSGATLDVPGPWDLWQVMLGAEDSVEVRPEFGTLMCEVIVRNPIHPGRLWLVGLREHGGDGRESWSPQIGGCVVTGVRVE